MQRDANETFRRRYAEDAAFREDRKARSRARYRINAATINAERKAARVADPETARAKDREKRARNPQKWREADARYAARNPEKARAKSVRTRLRGYGLTESDFVERLAAQDNRCAICRIAFSSTQHRHIDHDHDTGAVRGILCQHCNMMLGHARDNPETLIAASVYLENANENHRRQSHGLQTDQRHLDHAGCRSIDHPDRRQEHAGEELPA